MRAVAKKADLRDVLRDLVVALDSQHFMGKAPGSYYYSLNVTRALEEARKLLGGRPLVPPDEADVAGMKARS